MVWTTPRTWVDGETPTAALFNLHISDNLTLLKVSIGNAGRLRRLDSTTLASLVGTSITGVAHLAAANTYTAEISNFSGGSTVRVVVPVGVDKFGGTAGNKTAGSLWVEGNYLHHVASNQNEWRYLGTVVSTPGGGALAGSIWVEGNDVHYLDATAVERVVLGTASHSDALARAGSAWIETYLHWVVSTGTTEEQGHLDVHTDVGHTDSHSDVGHSDSHTDSHSDTGHSDGHSDAHVDSGTDHFDTHDDVHDDVEGDPHRDSHFDTHGDAHNDGHNDSHDDSHSDVGHSDSHSDVHDDAHTDSHSDAGHSDSHSDIPESMGT